MWKGGGIASGSASSMSFALSRSTSRITLAPRPETASKMLAKLLRRHHKSLLDENSEDSMKLPGPGPLPAELEPDSLAAFLWQQRQRRRIFQEKTEEMRYEWSRRRSSIIQSMQMSQMAVILQLGDLETTMLGRMRLMEQLEEMLSDVEQRMAQLSAIVAKQGRRGRLRRQRSSRKKTTKSVVSFLTRTFTTENMGHVDTTNTADSSDVKEQEGLLQQETTAAVSSTAQPTTYGQAAEDDGPESPDTTHEFSPGRAASRAESRASSRSALSKAVSGVSSRTVSRSSNKRFSFASSVNDVIPLEDDPIEESRPANDKDDDHDHEAALRALWQELALPDEAAPSNSTRCSNMSNTSTSRSKRFLLSQKAKIAKVLSHKNVKTMQEKWYVKLVEHRYMERFCIGVILVHAIFMGIRSEYEAQHLLDWEEQPWLVQHGDNIFVVWYVLELLLKFLAFRLNFFTNPDWKWNIFDIVCVLPWQVLIDLTKGGGGSGSGGLSFFRVLRLMKLARLLRMIRMMRCFRELRLMMSMMLESFSALVWAIFMILGIMYGFSVIFGMGVTRYLAKGEEKRLEDPICLGEIQENWGSLWRTMKTLFWSVTSGKDWDDTAHCLHQVDSLYFYVFIAYIIIMLLDFNILLGMYCAAAGKTSQEDKHSVFLEDIQKEDGIVNSVRRVMHKIDIEKSNDINWTEFETLSQDDKVHEFLEWMGIDPVSARQLFRAVSGGRDVANIDTFLDDAVQVRGVAARKRLSAVRMDMEMSMRQMRCVMCHFEDIMGVLAGTFQDMSVGPVVPLFSRMQMSHHTFERVTLRKGVTNGSIASQREALAKESI